MKPLFKKILKLSQILKKPTKLLFCYVIRIIIIKVLRPQHVHDIFKTNDKLLIVIS